MNLGPFTITRRRRGPNGSYQFPWQAITEDDLSPELRAAIARVARSVCKDYLQEVADWNWEPGSEPHSTFSLPPEEPLVTYTDAAREAGFGPTLEDPK